VTSLSKGYEQLPPAARPGPRAADGEAPEPSLGELTGRLGEQVSRLVRDEFALAQLETKQRLKRVGAGAAMSGMSALFAFFGACCAITAAVLGLANVMRPWAAAVAVAVIFFVLAAVVALPSWKVLTSRRPAVPRDRVESLRSDVSAVKAAAHP
jgi:membrane protein